MIRSEDLSSVNTLARIAQFTGLSLSGFSHNVANQRGNALVKDTVMMNTTRAVIYKLAQDACKMQRDSFGLVYRDCIQADKASMDLEAYFRQGR